MKEQIAQFHQKHGVRPYTLLLLGLFAVSNNVLAASEFVTSTNVI